MVELLLLHAAPVVRSARGARVSIDLSDAKDEELVERLRQADEEAFRGLFRRYAPTALALARRVVNQPFLAEEIVQEAFLSVWRNPDGYDRHRGSVRAWIMVMVHHRAVDTVRREESQRKRTEDPRGAEAVVEDFAEQVVDGLGLPEERKAVRAALRELPGEQRQVIELMYFGGLSQSKVAARLDLPLGTVKSRTLLGMRRLRAALAESRR